MQRLPKSLESDGDLKSFITKNSVPLFDGTEFSVPFLKLNTELQQALAFARRCGRLRGGLESIEVQLQGEAAGLAKTAAKGTLNQATGASRILFVSSDGSERFYRNVESLAIKHSPRLYVVRLDLDAAGLGSHFFGEDAKVKAMLVVEKDFVVRCFQGMQEKL